MTSSPINVLLVEDSRADALLLAASLEADAFDRFVLTSAERLGDALALLDQRAFDVVLLDLGLPDSQGLATFRRLRDHASAPPVVIVSGNKDERLAIEAVKAGAQDYLVKSQAGWDEATRAIRYAIERQRSQAALRRSEERFRALIENAPGAILVFGLEGDVRFASASLARMTGYDAADLVEHDLSAFAHPDDWPHVLAVTADLMAAPGSVRTLEYRFRHADGSWHWVENTVSNLLHDPSVGGITMNFHDITERKRAEAQLRSSEETVRALNVGLEARVEQRTAEVQDLYDNAPCGYHSLDPAGRILHINQTELAWLGRSREEVAGRPFADLITPATRGVFHQVFSELVRLGHVGDFEVDLLAADGSALPVVLSSSVVTAAAGEFVMSRMTAFDIRERRQAEHLTQEAAETQRLANLELARALRMKDEFLANMSHELRTPLTAILAMTEVLHAEVYGPVNDRQHKAVHTIDTSAQHLLSLINEILDLSKIEAGHMDVDLQDVVVDQVCQASLLFVKEMAAKKGLQIGYTPNTVVPRMMADPRRLKQMLINLLTNAVKFTPAGGSVTLAVHASAEAATTAGRVKDQGTIRFAVRDTGIGIAPEDAPRLFQPFTQLNASGLGRQEGTGLGLALVSRLAELHGGSIQVESAGIPGQGSVFTLELPIGTISAAPATGNGRRNEPRNEPLPVQPSPPVPGDGKAGNLVLLVDDNEVSVFAIQDYIEACGFRVAVAHSGVEAIARLEEVQPDLILMDIQMPEMDGLEAMRRIRKHPRFNAVPIIALTALAMAEDRERCLRVGASDYLSKPVSPKVLVATMRRLLGAE